MTRRQGIGFVLLCLWASAAWFTVDLLPGRLALINGQGLHFFLIGFLAMLYQGLRRRRGPGGFASVVPWGVVGVGLLAVPLVLLDAAQSMSALVPGVVVFALIPVVVVTGVGRMALLVPALAGVAGVLLLVPAQMPGSPRGWEGLGLTVLAAGVTGACLVVLPRMLRGVETGWAVAVMCLGSGVVLGGAGVAAGGEWTWGAVGVEMARGVLFDLPEVVLLLWLVKAVEPYRVAARYLVAPLFTVIEGYVLLKPGLDLRTGVGVTLLAGGGWWLLRAEAEEPVRLGLV
ncbi:hypothetical protein [Granulicella sibirica]|uniref:EamA domain-containing protein n=1 Tax=Granulicella sibirica TaxID=2479048 RepID=A0A4Q0SY72_9BACT|nr:hypothetical protein [Granulicella sibirica]RXH55817.1 hypothetical protein GRAN_2674 [Granulicella sibirica]